MSDSIKFKLDKINNEINNIKNTINKVKEIAKLKIKHANTKEQKRQILSQYKKDMEELKNNKAIKERYMILNKKKKKLESDFNKIEDSDVKVDSKSNKNTFFLSQDQLNIINKLYDDYKTPSENPISEKDTELGNVINNLINKYALPDDIIKLVDDETEMGCDMMAGDILTNMSTQKTAHYELDQDGKCVIPTGQTSSLRDEITINLTDNEYCTLYDFYKKLKVLKSELENM